MVNTVLFDLDGTLLPMDIDEFIKAYFGALGKKLAMLGYDAQTCMNALMAGTKAMVKNDGSKLNETIFWEVFTQVSGVKRETCEGDFENFYRNEFCELGNLCEQNQNMVKAVSLLKEKGYRLLLTTNPMFPKMAVEERVRWAGIDANAFDIMTSYETCHYTKPNVGYYKEVIEKENLTIEECMMVGNDSLEDGVIESLGIPLYLIEDYLIHREDTPLQSKWHSNSADFLAFVEGLPSVK